MTSSLRPLLPALIAFALPATLSAQPPGDRGPGEMIKRADTDGDGRVSRREFLEARTAELEAAFDRIDTNGDGQLDEPEAAEAAARFRALAAGGRDAPRRPEAPRPVRPAGDRPDGSAPGEEAFNRFDRDGDGRLSRDEFDEGMARMRQFMQRNGQQPGPMDRGERGPEQGFRRPPQQD